MSVTIKWQDNNTIIGMGHRIYKSPTYFTKDSLPTMLVELGPDVTEYVDSAGVSGENWYRVSALLDNGYEVFSEAFIAGKFLIGNTAFIGGDLTAGFLGEVPSSDFITGDALASAIGLTAGNPQNSDVPWWQFALDNEILYVPTKSFRSKISWDDINAVNAVYNDANASIVTIGGYNFRVTLMTGAEADPTVDENGAGSEWNRLIYRVHSTIPQDQIGDNWANYNPDNTNITSGNQNGFQIWCQETIASDTSRRVTRGYNSIDDFDGWIADRKFDPNGWRPVLRLIQ